MYAFVACIFFVGAAVASSDKSGPSNDYSDETSRLCLIIWIVAWISYAGALAYWVWDMKSVMPAQAQAKSVPMCISYVIVRVGEWTMCMLGETVLSLLGVPLKSDMMVYFMFACSMLIAGNLQFQGYTIHPIHAEHHILAKGQFTFKGLLYIFWGTIIYASILVTIGASAKVLTKKATYGLVWEGANWCLSAGIAAAFVSNMSFAYLHHSNDQHQEKKRTTKQYVVWALKAATVVALIVIALLDLEPNAIVVSALCSVQTAFLLSCVNKPSQC